jgi:hypothetical protein
VILRFTGNGVGYGQDKDQGFKDGGADHLAGIFRGHSPFHNESAQPYALIEIDGHHEVRSCRGEHLKGCLAKLFWKREREALNEEDLNSAFDVIRSRVKFDMSSGNASFGSSKCTGDFSGDHSQALC